MAKNTYLISVHLEHNVLIEADTEEEADKMVSAELHEEGYGDLSIIGTKVIETRVDGPANYEKYMAAWQHYHAVLGEKGFDHPDTLVARLAADEANKLDF
jgi:hypothetical protein